MILYKYLQPARVDVLERKMIRFTPPGDFNDPFEFRPCIESAASDEAVRGYVEANFDTIMETELRKYGALLSGYEHMVKELALRNKPMVLNLFRQLEPGFLNKLGPSFNSIFNQNVGIMCLSEIPDSILMWGHYTDCHRGFVIGYDSDHPFFSKRRGPDDEFGFLRQVVYQRQRPQITLSDTSSPAWFNTKSDQWTYEKEWRMLRILSEADCRDKKTGFSICLFGFPEDSVLEIIIGLRATPSLIQELKSLSRAFPRASLLQASESSHEYSIELTKLS
jgi:Protein of unknown function (DUF2971)